VRSFNLRSVIW